jgi:two-component system phosphate regulon response regulator PhoB
MVPDLIILDLMLPGLDGLEVCRRLKADARTRSIPIVMLTARGDATDIVAGLELGAADYLTKPISPRILLAHIRAVLRRAEDALSGSAIRIKALSIHPGRHEVLLEGQRLALTATEFRILLSLAKRPGWVFTRQQLLNAARDNGAVETEHFISERAIDVHIVSLRRKLGQTAGYIETVRGVGYRLQDE